MGSKTPPNLNTLIRPLNMAYKHWFQIRRREELPHTIQMTSRRPSLPRRRRARQSLRYSRFFRCRGRWTCLVIALLLSGLSTHGPQRSPYRYSGDYPFLTLRFYTSIHLRLLRKPHLQLEHPEQPRCRTTPKWRKRWDLIKESEQIKKNGRENWCGKGRKKNKRKGSLFLCE